MDENSPLLSDKISLNGDILLTKNKYFKWAIPSQETINVKKDRFNSIKLCYFVMFLSSVSYTITISSMWPYLQEIDDSATTQFLGYVVGIFSIGQLLSSLVFGYWSSKKRFHKIPIMVSISLMIIGNLIYFYIQTIESIADKSISAKYLMLISRLIIGSGAASAAVVRAYISSATTMAERTGCLASLAACQGIGFIVGPILQVAFVPIGYPGLDNSVLPVNIYTSPAVFSILVSVLLNLLILFKFNEYAIYTIGENNEDLKRQKIDDLISAASPPDYIAIILITFLFFLNCFVFSFFESVISPMTIDMYGWSNQEATLFNGIIIGTFGVLSVGVILIAKILVKRFKERILMLIGFIVMFFGHVLLISWGNDYPSIQIQTLGPPITNETFNATFSTEFSQENITSTSTASLTTVEPKGCPIDYEWCQTTPKIEFHQFLSGMFLMVIGYSISNIMSFAIFSKLQPSLKPQGTIMGILTAFGSIARTAAPILVTQIYQSFGHRVCFISMTGVLFLASILIILTLKRYKPYSVN